MESPWGFMQRRTLRSLEVNGYGTTLAVEDGDWINGHLVSFLWDSKEYLGNF